MQGEVRITNALYLSNRGDATALAAFVLFEGDSFFGGTQSDREYARILKCGRAKVSRLRQLWGQDRATLQPEGEHPSLLNNSIQFITPVDDDDPPHPDVPVPTGTTRESKERFKPVTPEELDGLKRWAAKKRVRIEDWGSACEGFALYADSTDKLRTRRGWLAQLRTALKEQWRCVRSGETQGAPTKSTYADRVQAGNLEATRAVIASYTGAGQS